MGEEISKARFRKSDAKRFAARLRDETALARRWFDDGKFSGDGLTPQNMLLTQVGTDTEITLQAWVINAYNRANLFALDRFTLRRTDQLPLIPTVGMRFEF